MKVNALKAVTLVLMLTTLLMQDLQAQDDAPVEKEGFDRSRLFGGGSFILNFGDITIINISPQVGYHFNRYFAAGVGINGQYSSFKTINGYDGSTLSREEYGVAGLNVFGRFYPIQQVILQVQPEANYVWGKVKYYDTNQEYKLDGKIIPSLLLGAGGAIPMGRSGALNILAQYDILQNDRTPYGNKVFFSFGYNFGL
jgi:hypothetical protein